MSRKLICTVLGIPVEPWPPDHYTLIGLDPAKADAANVEQRVQELSARLRSYQLMYPDEVTDALNRLAQALVCLTEPADRRLYDLSRIGAMDLAPMPPAADAPTSRITSRAPAPAETLSDARRGARRTDYRRLAVGRRLHAAWTNLGWWFGDPAFKLQSLQDAVELIRAAWTVRDVLLQDRAPMLGADGGPGDRVVALARDPHVLRSYKRLNARERADLAADWRASLSVIDRELRSLRQRVRRRRSMPRPVIRAARYFVNDGLDYTLLVLGLLALGIAIWRSRI